MCVGLSEAASRRVGHVEKRWKPKKKKVRKKSLDSLHAIGQGSPTGGNEFNWSTRSSLPPTLLPHLREGGGGKKRKEKKGSKPTREIGEEEEDGWVAVVLNDKNQTRSHQPSQQAWAFFLFILSIKRERRPAKLSETLCPTTKYISSNSTNFRFYITLIHDYIISTATLCWASTSFFLPFYRFQTTNLWMDTNRRREFQMQSKWIISTKYLYEQKVKGRREGVYLVIFVDPCPRTATI